MFGRERLTLEIDIGSEIDNLSDRPTESNANDAAKKAHGTRLCEEKFTDVAVAGADGLHDANFASALEDCHHESVHDPNEGDSQRKAAEDSEKHVQHFEELLYAFAGIKDREGVEAHLLNGIFHL